jgi:hypothetical protein
MERFSRAPHKLSRLEEGPWRWTPWRWREKQYVLGLMNRLGVVLTKNEPLKSVRRIAAEAASYGAQ